MPIGVEPSSSDLKATYGVSCPGLQFKNSQYPARGSPPSQADGRLAES